MKLVFWLTSPLVLALATAVHAEVLNIPEPGVAASEEIEMPANNEATSQDLTIDPVEPPAERIPMEVHEEAPDAAPETASEPMAPTSPVSVTLPGRGMLKEQVAERFGSPTEKVEAVGEPPISRWVYPGFTVYFEHDHVIHAVHHK